MSPRPAQVLAALDPPSASAATEALLVSGGDARLALDPATGANRYGCPPRPVPLVLDFASATASIISPRGFAAADALRRRLAQNTREQGRAWARLREELPELFGLGEFSGLSSLLAPSGTDLHALALAFAHSGAGADLTILLAEPSETGSGVPSAMAGPPLRLAHPRSKDVSLRTVAIRHPDGSPRAAEEVDGEFAAQARLALDEGREVLLVVLDVSKTGLTAPSPALTLSLMDRPGVRVLVDACQARLAPATLAAWLRAGAMLAVTGSKFLGGPSFSGVLFVPAALAHGRPDPGGMATDRHPGQPGLLLRWEAALAELRLFRHLPGAEVQAILRDFGRFLAQRLSGETLMEALPGLPVDRSPLVMGESWDQETSVFALRFRLPDGRSLTPGAVSKLYRLLRQDVSHGLGVGLAAIPVQLGQPVSCGAPDGTPGAALRLCLSARQLIQAAEEGGATRLMDQSDTIIRKISLILNGLSE